MSSSYDPERHHRRSIRLKGYDYQQAGAYFVTIVIQGRACLFGEVMDETMQLRDAGRMVEQRWQELNAMFPTIETDAYVIMPNHVHGIIIINATIPSSSGVTTSSSGVTTSSSGVTTTGMGLDNVVGAFKSLTTVDYIRGVRTCGWAAFDRRLWQRNYYRYSP